MDYSRFSANYLLYLDYHGPSSLSVTLTDNEVSRIET